MIIEMTISTRPDDQPIYNNAAETSPKSGPLQAGSFNRLATLHAFQQYLLAFRPDPLTLKLHQQIGR